MCSWADVSCLGIPDESQTSLHRTPADLSHQHLLWKHQYLATPVPMMTILVIWLLSSSSSDSLCLPVFRWISVHEGSDGALWSLSYSLSLLYYWVKGRETAQVFCCHLVRVGFSQTTICSWTQRESQSTACPIIWHFGWGKEARYSPEETRDVLNSTAN